MRRTLRSPLTSTTLGAVAALVVSLSVVPGSSVTPLAGTNGLPPGTAPVGDGPSATAPAVELGASWDIYSPAPGFKAQAPRAAAWDVLRDGRTFKEMAVSFSANPDIATEDAVNVVARSANSGQTFNSVGPSNWMSLNMAKLADGSLITVDFIPEWTDATQKNIELTVFRSADGEKWARSTAPVTLPAGTGWSGMDRGMRVARGMTQLPDGTLLMPGYTMLTGDQKWRVILLQSTDLGKSWTVRSTIGISPTAHLGEPGITWTSDNRMIAVMRTDYHPPFKVAPTELVAAFSDDEGKTWSDEKPVIGPDGAIVKGIDPNFSLQPNGMLLLAYGRPDNQLLVSADGTGRSWTDHQVVFSNAFDTTTPIEEHQQRAYGSGGNTSILPVAANRSLYFYDRCVTNNWCKSYNEQYGIGARYIDALTPGVGKIDVLTTLLAGTASVTGDFAAGDSHFPELRPEGAFDGSSMERAATALSRSDGTAPSMVLKLDRPYRLDKLGIMLGTGQSMNADIQFSADGKAWGKPDLKIRGTRDRAMRYYQVPVQTVQYIQLTGDKDVTTPIVEMELYSANVDTFENDAPFAIPRGFTDASNATVTNVEAGGFHSERSLRLLDRRNDQMAQITKVTPDSPFQSTRFKLAYEFGGNPVYFSVIGHAGGKLTQPWQFRVNDPSGAGKSLQVLTAGAWKSLGAVASFPVTDAASNIGQWNDIAIEAGPSMATVIITGQRFAVNDPAAEPAESLAGIKFRSDSDAMFSTELFIDDLQIDQHTAPSPTLANLTVNAAVAFPGAPLTVRSTLTNPGTQAATSVWATLQTPPGWAVKTDTLPSTIGPGASTEISWTLTPPTSIEPGSYPISGIASYQVGPEYFEALTPATKVSVGVVPSSKITATASSFQPGATDPAKAIDGNVATIWHTKYSPTKDPLPQSITLDLGAEYHVSGLGYLPRQDNQPNGIITGYAVYASADGVSYREIGDGQWAANNTNKTAAVDAPGTRFVRLEATAGVGGLGSAAELTVFVQ